MLKKLEQISKFRSLYEFKIDEHFFLYMNFVFPDKIVLIVYPNVYMSGATNVVQLIVHFYMLIIEVVNIIILVFLFLAHLKNIGNFRIKSFVCISSACE